MSDRPPPAQPLPPKKDVALALLEGPSVFVHLDPRREGVAVPKWFKKQPQLVLQVGFNMAVSIPDLEVGDEGISCTLSFNRSPHWCFMPWSAIYALIGEDGRAMIWPDDVPAELAKQLQKPKLSAVPNKVASKANKPKSDEPAKASKKPALAAVSDAPADEPADAPADGPAVVAAADEPQQEDDGKKKLPSYLRVIK